ncbi:MAG: hypothetical protein J07HQW2_01189 [Haloquadratum walsbyi J07HQW2]|uniref:Uncharacterized protein n=1 Tax=Haloquadratum walsbyi J07HQW2 TaxID=1238425 RepID=U1NDE4_9EURY|nr:MAG: hypothetical protein J07HQW2_01189 [Haloquadratum walsbyi J07HQW2]
MFPHPWWFVGRYATVSTLFGRVCRVNLEVRPFAVALVRQQSGEDVPRCRCSVLAVTGRFQHRVDIQLFNSHEVVFGGVVI